MTTLRYTVRKLFSRERAKYGCRIELNPGALELYPANPERAKRSPVLFLAVQTSLGHDLYKLLPGYSLWSRLLLVECTRTEGTHIITYRTLPINPAPWDELFAMIPWVNRTRVADPMIDWMRERAPEPFPTLMETALCQPSPAST